MPDQAVDMHAETQVPGCNGGPVGISAAGERTDNLRELELQAEVELLCAELVPPPPAPCDPIACKCRYVLIVGMLLMETTQSKFS